LSVVSIDAGARTGGLVDSSAEGIVFEADRAATAGERDARQAVLEVPCVACGVRAVGVNTFPSLS
jgi:hypothetical protein